MAWVEVELEAIFREDRNDKLPLIAAEVKNSDFIPRLHWVHIFCPKKRDSGDIFFCNRQRGVIEANFLELLHCFSQFSIVKAGEQRNCKDLFGTWPSDNEVDKCPPFGTLFHIFFPEFEFLDN